MVLDTAYQLYVLRAFYIGQLFIVTVACAIAPYVLIRGPITRLARRFYKKPTKDALPVLRPRRSCSKSTP